MSDVIQRLRVRAQSRRRRILMPEADDPRVVEAANEFQRAGFGQAVVLDPPLDAQLDTAVEVLRGSDTELLERCVDRLVANRRHKGMTDDRAREAVADRLLLAALLVSLGVVDGSVAGSLATTASVLRAGIYGLGMKPGCDLVSSFFLMSWAQRTLTFADCAVVPEPNAQQLAEIALSSAASHLRLVDETPRVALLSFSTRGSAAHPDVDRIVEAVRLARAANPELLIDGELQFDAAVIPEVASRKAPSSPVAGQANVLIFPDLNSGNIGYKIAERLGGIQAIGPIIQGLQAPFMDLSRGCQVQDIIDVAVVASVLS